MFLKKIIAIYCTTCIIYMVNGQQDISPCPRLFVYESKSSEPNRWYGIITLLSDTDLNGVWLRIIFDQPTLQLGNWFGEPVPRDSNREYLVRNKNFQLKAHTPQTVRFYVDYDSSKAVPRLASFILNARQQCPEENVTDTIPEAPKLQTSSNLGGISKPTPVSIVTRPEDNTNTGGEDDFFPGDFSFINQTQPNPITNENLDAICGTVVARPKPLITYGQATQEGEFPWHAALYYAKGIDLTYICGGSLISRHHVITVAHCVTKRRKTTPLNANNLSIYLGKYYLKRFTGAGIQDQQVTKIIPHPQYDPSTYSNDIAVLKFSAVEITNYVRPVCLWQESTELNAILNKQGSVVGWGFDETGKVTETLMQAKMPVVSHETCIFSYPDFYSRFTSNNSFCAGFINGTSVCNGDSGGGMVFPKSDSDFKNPVWHLRGLVSISVALQNQFKCDSTHYVVFTDSAKYLDWIKQSMLE